MFDLVTIVITITCKLIAKKNNISALNAILKMTPDAILDFLIILDIKTFVCSKNDQTIITIIYISVNFLMAKCISDSTQC